MQRSKSPADYRRTELAKIHIARAALGLDRDTYEDILWTICRVRSSADLDSTGRFKLLKHFRSLGWAPSRGKNSAPMDAKSRKVWSLWYQLKDAGLIGTATARTLRTEVKTLTGCDDLKFCTEAQKSHVIECLKQWLARASK